MNELNDLLKIKCIEGEICVFGGSYITLIYKDDRMTDDIDSIFIKGKKEIIPLLQEIAVKHGLIPTWLNDAVKETVEMGKKLTKKVHLAYSNLTIYMPPPEFILAMKVMSSRADTKDFEDIQLLVRELKINSIEQIDTILNNHFPTKEIDYRNRIFLEELIKDVTQSETGDD
ncbi:MAG: hypothetical protein HQK77_18955 [Desulfobacterales bacterium]|nr:hypothetical protein [Desulfobacterales bacterium]